MLPLNKAVPTLAFAVAAAMASGAQAAPVVIENGYVKAGVSDRGTLGSNGNAPPGILYNTDGSGIYGVNDFLTPGTPFEGFYVKSNLGTYGSNNSGASSFGFVSPTLLTGTSASWSGGNSYFGVDNLYSLATVSGQSLIHITTTLTNRTSSTITGLEFLRTLDPDPDVNAYGTYHTVNTVVSAGQACATGSYSGQTICIFNNSSFAHQAGVSSSWSTNPSVYLAGTNSGNGDYAIGLAYSIGSLAGGESVTLRYGYAMGGSFEVASVDPTTVPEPASLALLAGGLVGLGWLGRRRRIAA